MSYGLAYGLSAFGLSQQLGISAGEAKQMMDDYFERFGAAADYPNEAVERVRLTGYTETLLSAAAGTFLISIAIIGSAVRWPNGWRLNAPHPGIRRRPRQGCDAECGSWTQGRRDEDQDPASGPRRTCPGVGPGESEAATDLVREQMARAADPSVPLSVSVGLGRSWHDAAH